ncbi:MAG: polysulfide reductase NrfD [Desulfohalobiaceae bacterium]|nr:polysulfide reductase NrfD [Desulfohalobiaceae bacterium]
MFREQLQSVYQIHKNHSRDVHNLPFIWLGAVFLVLGLIGVLLVLFKGHEAVYGVSREVPWGLLIATYAYLVITSTGLAFIGGLGHAFGFEKFAKMNKRIVVLAFITLLAGFTQIGMELGHPFRLMYLFLLSPHFQAPIVWMGIFYSMELVILGVELYLIFRPGKTNRQLTAVFGFLALLVGVIATSNLGFVFGSINARPFYHGIYFPVFLVVSGIAAGAALLLVINNIVSGFKVREELQDSMQALGKLMGLGIGVMIFLYAWKLISSVYSEPEGMSQAALALISGPMALHFWIGEVGLALVLPLLLIVLCRGRNSAILGLSGLIYMLGLFFTRYDFVVAGQLPPMRPGFEGSGVDTVKGLVHYTPSPVEWMIFALGLGVFFFFYFLAERYLDLQT